MTTRGMIGTGEIDYKNNVLTIIIIYVIQVVVNKNPRHLGSPFTKPNIISGITLGNRYQFRFQTHVHQMLDRKLQQWRNYHDSK